MIATTRWIHWQTLSVIGMAAVLAGCEAPQSRMRDIDPQADQSFRQMCEALDGAKAFSFRVNATMDRPVDTGQLAQFHRTSEITVVRPDRLYARTESDDGSWSVWYRASKLTILDRDANKYATEDVPGTIGKMLDYMVDKYDLVVPMADLVIGKTYDGMMADVDSVTYLGLHSVDDTKCHHLLCVQENLNWQIWIDAGQQPLPRKLVITYLQEQDEPQYVALIDRWNLAPTVSRETFKFTPPAGAKSVAMSDLIDDESGDLP